ncbi:MAG TPA: hypothetical protein VF530_03145 [Planctomycetota bacterium]
MKPSISLSIVLALAAGLWMTDPSAAAQARPEESPAATSRLADDELSRDGRRLLDLAFAAATAMPAHPHVKTRSLLQEEVVRACIELGQLRTARAYADQIANWRKGAACAELARPLVERGLVDEARRCLAIAQAAADELDRKLQHELGYDDGAVESPQDWQRDQIRVRMAQALVLHGEEEQAAALEAGVVESEAGRVDAVRARQATAEDFEVLMVALETELPGMSFDRARNALEACVELYGRFYADAERRARAERALRDPAARLPMDVRFELLRRAAGAALLHGDTDKARELLREADAIVKKVCASGAWIPEHEIPLRASLASLRHSVGDAAGARAELAEAAARYEAERANIVEIYRAGALRPLAEAALALGDGAGALTFYRRALEEGALNANARPRAEDLVATCLSMARLGVTPDPELWQRILAIRAGLVAPW